MNRTGIRKTNGMPPQQILFNVEHQVSIGVIVGKDIDSSIIVEEDGRKIVKAGTPMNCDLTNSRVCSYGDKTADGVLLHDVDVTETSANGTLLIFGFVNVNRLANNVKALITDDVKTALNAKVTFLAG